MRLLSLRRTPLRPRLGVMLVCRGPASRVEAIVRSVRDEVDEVVVAFDSAGDPDVPRRVGHLADTFRTFQSPTGFGGAIFLWAMRLCRADWILRLDDDEIASPALVAEARERTEDAEITHALVPRRWLWPDGDRFIASRPWGSDLQLRLVRNVPALWRAGGDLHFGHEVLGPAAVLRSPFYHADLAVRSAEVRRAKAERYERRRPGIRLEGLSVNALYLPETFDGLELAAVPRDDLAVCRALCLPASELWTPAPDRTDVVPAQEVLAPTGAVQVSDAAHAGVVTVPDAPSALPAGEPVRLAVELHNLSSQVWPSVRAAGSPIRLGVSWQGPRDEGPTDAPRVLLDAPLHPGGRLRIPVLLAVPEEPGRHVLRLALVHEDVAWFGEDVRLEIDVVIPQRVPLTPGAAVPRGLPRPRRDGFHGAFGLDGMDLELLEQLGRQERGTFVEAGANDGVTQSNTLLLELSLGWSGLLVEPIPRLAAAARRNRPGCIVEEVALVPAGFDGDSVEIVDAGLMSLVGGAMGDPDAEKRHVAKARDLQPGLRPRTLTVPASTLSALLDRHDLGAPDLLVLDVEGFEAPVLTGLDLARHAPRHVLVEARFRAQVDGALAGRYEAVAEIGGKLDVLYRLRS